MIIDTHCHILPGVDDGAKNADETRRMLRMAFKDGIDEIIATPHFNCDMDASVLEKRMGAYLRTCKYAKEMNPTARIYLGNELYYSEGVVDALDRGDALTLNQTKYVLVEFPVYSEFRYIRQAVQNLQYAGYLPVIAHIERYQGMKKEEQVAELAGMGACMQVNVSSVMGKAGWSTRWYLLKLMRHGLIHVLGTDAHGATHRRPEMRDCLSYIDKKIGKTYREEISTINPSRIIRGEYISG